jgi:hypothetical protein
MKKINLDQSVFKPMEHKQSDKANTVFLKLYAKLNKPKNPFDEVRSYTPPQTNNKPGETLNDQN